MVSNIWFSLDIYLWIISKSGQTYSLLPIDCVIFVGLCGEVDGNLMGVKIDIGRSSSRDLGC